MPNERNDDYPVGFGKPLKHTQFRKGQSGNPKGRPRGSKDIATLIDNELEERVSATENGRTKTVSKLTALVKQLVNQAVSGNLAATKMLLPQMERREEANRQAIAEAETPRTTPSLADFRKALDYLEFGIEPSDDDHALPKS
jgi:hypothetical protein